MNKVAWVPYPDVATAERVLGRHDGLTYRPFTEVDHLPGDPSEVNFLVLPYMAAPTVFAQVDQLTGLEVVQLQSAGYDNIPELPAGVRLCNGGGIHDTATAEITLALILAKLRRIDVYARNMTSGTWDGQWSRGLAYSRVTLIGYGRIGQAIEARLLPFEPSSITRVARSARTEPAVHSVEKLPELLTQTDIAIIIAPLTEQTRGLFDANMLAQLPDGALLVNVGRGPIVDTDALVAEVSSGRLHAVMDVTDPEPLPADHPLWTSPNVLISPHVGGYSDAFPRRRDALVRAQIERWISGAPLDCVVRGGGSDE